MIIAVMDNFFYLRDGENVKRVDVLEWAAHIGEQRNVKQTTVGDTLVSTCFFGTNCGTTTSPIFFETMVFSSRGTTAFKFRSVTAALDKHRSLVTKMTQTTNTTRVDG